MRRNRYFVIVLVACACGIWLYNIVLVSSVKIADVHGAAPVFGDAAVYSAHSSLVEKALGLPSAGQATSVIPDFETPFKAIAESNQGPAAVHGAAHPPASRSTFALKGILYKTSPLAIIEDAHGKTSILGVGDTLDSQTITAITRTTVSLKDKRGSYNLSVKE